MLFNKLNYKDIKEGDDWGKKWESAWFELSIKIPSDWKGKTLATNLDFSGEGLVFDSKGNEIQGITNGAIWDPNFARTRVIINHKLILNQIRRSGWLMIFIKIHMQLEILL